MAKGRMLNNKISLNKALSKMSDFSALAYTWGIAHLDKNGVMHGDPCVFLSIVFPRRRDINPEHVQKCIREWEAAGLAYQYEAEGDTWLWYPKFEENQIGLRADREPDTGWPVPDNLPEDVRQPSGNDPESIPPNRTEVNITEQNRTEQNTGDLPEKDIPYLPLAEHLAERITENDEHHFRGKDRQRIESVWSTDMRLLVERDGREKKLVESVIDWCQADEFWKANILSAGKLRKQFPTLLLQMNRKNGSNGGPRASPEDWEKADPEKYYKDEEIQL